MTVEVICFTKVFYVTAFGFVGLCCFSHIFFDVSRVLQVLNVFPIFSRFFFIFPAPSPRFYLTGHSLGGGLAKLVALEVGRKSATGASGFNGNPWANHGKSP